MTASVREPRGDRLRRLPGVSLLRSTHGLQRFTLVAGLVLVVGFVLVAILAPLLAPYGFAQTSADGIDFEIGRASCRERV